MSLQPLSVRLPRWLYILLVVVSSELSLLGLSALILLATGQFEPLPLLLLGILSIYKTIIASILMVVGARWRWNDSRSAFLGFGGWYLGRIVGLVLGLIVGSKYGGAVGAIIGAIGLYLLFGRLGRWVSIRLDLLAEKWGISAAPGVTSPPPMFSGRLWWLAFAWAIGMPTFFGLAALFWNGSGSSIVTLADALPWARIGAAILSLLAIVSPWLLLKRAQRHPQPNAVAPHRALHFIGAVSGAAPAVYGPFLQIFFGASVAEALLFCLVGAAVGVFWASRIASAPEATQSV